MAFAQRIEAGEAFQEQLMSLLSKRGDVASVCANGTEHTHPDFVSLLRSNNTRASKFVRFAPDGVYMKKDGEVIHFDAKAGKSIEKDAYEAYMALRGLGCRLLLFVKTGEGEMYFQDIEKVVLIDGEVTVSPFPANRRFPVEDGWICPRKKAGTTGAGNGSGTPYREIDFSSMKRFQLTD